MPLLDRNGARLDPWTRSEGAAIAGLSHALVPWEGLSEALALKAGGQRLGVAIPNNLPVAELAPVLDRLALVAVRFPAYSDGRGFSQARLIRGHGFTGALRASGPLIADQFAYALACGFDEIELPEANAARQPLRQWQTALRQISRGYQRGYVDRVSILDQRRAARDVNRAAAS